jgi:hypothetical protein
MDREPPESLAYRAAVLGCLLGLDEVPGSIRTWAEKTEGRAPPQLVEPPPDPWGTFEVDGVEIFIPKLSADEERGWGLIARRDRPGATLDVLPDEVGFPIARVPEVAVRASSRLCARRSGGTIGASHRAQLAHRDEGVPTAPEEAVTAEAVVGDGLTEQGLHDFTRPSAALDLHA